MRQSNRISGIGQPIPNFLDNIPHSWKQTILNQNEYEANLDIDRLYSGPTYHEISTPAELSDTDGIVRDLNRIDWAFASDDTSYLTHDIHPYPAKFIPQIPGHIIARLSLPGELVLDPFGGSGTTALEAIRLGRRAVSVDANPIGALIGKVKTTRIDEATLTDLHSVRSLLLTKLPNLPSDPIKLINEFNAYIPEITHREIWFPDTSCGELALIRSCIASMESEKAKNIALLALSRIILKVSFQDSETRYVSRKREIQKGETIKRFIINLETITGRVIETEPNLQYGAVNFITGDTRKLDSDIIPSESVDLIVTSPPYGNANDYHLYHRFRLLWLGFDPRSLAKIEIGSHLRHQKESSGFEAYLFDITECLKVILRLLKPGRYAALVIGDAIYRGVIYEGAESVAERAASIGFETICILSRKLHPTKRSFTVAGRRASSEKILLLRKPCKPCSITLNPPPYRLWSYEDNLRTREISKLLGDAPQKNGDKFVITTDPYKVIEARRLVFSHSVDYEKGFRERTWQATLENGLAQVQSSRKDPKYVTHGLHPYKGKFYPQLAKGLINITGVQPGSVVLDPFCGSGTTLLECYLNGLTAFGCDMHPLAVKIARAKVGILNLNPHVVSETVSTLIAKLKAPPSNFLVDTDQFAEGAIEEIYNWFAEPVIAKLNWLLKSIRSVSAGILLDFFEVILSSIIRDISQQDPTDLRIRRRKEPLIDADVIGMFREQLIVQFERVSKFWSIRGYCPYHFIAGKVCEGDSRKDDTFSRLGLEDGSVDLVLTSPPYATALPYIDTDRLSLLVLFGMNSTVRRPIEFSLTGSREITSYEKSFIESKLSNKNCSTLPDTTADFIASLYEEISKADVGFRRKNLPALLSRFFSDMQQVLANCQRLLKPGGEAMIVIGDNTTTLNGIAKRIPTTDLLEDMGKKMGFEIVERIPITVTTENLIHVRNAITKNVVLRLRV